MYFVRSAGKKIFPVLLPLLILPVLLTSCGYRMGSMMHPQIKSVAIAPVKNETMEVMAATILRNQLSEKFMTDGSLKVTTLEKADCIVYCRITKVSNDSIVWESTDRDKTNRPSEFEISVSAEFMVLLPGHAKPLVSTREVTGKASYQFLIDPQIGRENGLRQASLAMAKLIVQYTTEAW